MRCHTICFCCIAFVLLASSAGPAKAEEIAIVAMNGSGQVAFISIENETVIKTVDVNVPYPLFVEATPDGNTAVVVCATGHVCFIDIPTMELVKTQDPGLAPTGVTVTTPETIGN